MGIDQMSASDLLELSHDFTEEDLNELTEDDFTEEDLNELTEDESSDVTGPVVDGDLNSRTKRGIFLKKLLFKKHLLKKLKNKLKKGLPGPGPLGFLPLIKKKLKKIPGPFGFAPLVIKKALGNPVKKALVKPALAAPFVKAGLGIPVKAGLGIKKKAALDAAGLGVKKIKLGAAGLGVKKIGLGAAGLGIKKKKIGLGAAGLGVAAIGAKKADSRLEPRLAQPRELRKVAPPPALRLDHLATRLDTHQDTHPAMPLQRCAAP